MIEIESFGYLHGQPPTAHLTLDVRDYMRDPAAIGGLLDSTGLDPEVRRVVLRTSGAREALQALRAFATTFPGGRGTARIAIGCAGGCHRSVVLAELLAESLTTGGYPAAAVHRDVHRPRVLKP